MRSDKEVPGTWGSPSGLHRPSDDAPTPHTGSSGSLTCSRTAGLQTSPQGSQRSVILSPAQAALTGSRAHGTLSHPG